MSVLLSLDLMIILSLGVFSYILLWFISLLKAGHGQEILRKIICSEENVSSFLLGIYCGNLC